jgi:hypothetical protein
MSAPPDPGSVFVDHRPNLRRWKVILAAAGVLLLLLTLVYAVRATVSSPDSAVRSYFGALADRDPAAALRRIAPEVAGPVERDLITAAVLDSPDYAPPEQVEVTEVVVDGRMAVAEVSYTVAGRARTASLRLRRDEGLADTLLHRWLVVDGVGSIILGQTPAEITVNGVPVPAFDAQAPRILPALPGSYQLGVPADDPMWQERATAVEVAPQQATEVDVAMVVRPAVRDEVDRQLARLLDGCAESTELLPPGCPFGYARVATAEDVRWRIARYPSIRISAGQEAGAPVMVVTSASDGEAVVTGTPRFGRPLAVTVPFPVAGTATLRGSTVVFRPDW